MAYTDLHQFLLDLARHPVLRQVLSGDPAAAEKLMTDANLSNHEKDLIRSGDEQSIRKYLGDEFAKASMILLKP